MLSRTLRQSLFKNARRQLSTEVQSAAANTEKAMQEREKYLQFSKAPLLDNFGDL